MYPSLRGSTASQRTVIGEGWRLELAAGLAPPDDDAVIRSTSGVAPSTCRTSRRWTASSATGIPPSPTTGTIRAGRTRVPCAAAMSSASEARPASLSAANTATPSRSKAKAPLLRTAAHVDVARARQRVRARRALDLDRTPVAPCPHALEGREGDDRPREEAAPREREVSHHQGERRLDRTGHGWLELVGHHEKTAQRECLFRGSQHRDFVGLIAPAFVTLASTTTSYGRTHDPAHLPRCDIDALHELSRYLTMAVLVRSSATVTRRGRRGPKFFYALATRNREPERERGVVSRVEDPCASHCRP